MPVACTATDSPVDEYLPTFQIISCRCLRCANTVVYVHSCVDEIYYFNNKYAASTQLKGGSFLLFVLKRNEGHFFFLTSFFKSSGTYQQIST